MDKDILTEAWEQSSPFTMEEAKKFLASQIRGVPDIDDDDPDCAKCFLLMGHAGIGKTRMIHQVGALAEAEVFAYHHGATVEEDNLGLPYIKDGVVCTAKPEHMPLFYREPTSPNGKGIFFQDEIFSGQGMGHQNISRMIIDRRHGATAMKRGWYLCAATNPETVEYGTVKSVDKALASRMIILVLKPHQDEKLAYWSGKMHRLVYQFLLLSRGGEKSYIEALDSRSWYNLAHTIGKAHSARIGSETLVKLMKTHTTPEIANAFMEYLANGDDLDKYPIQAKNILLAEPGELKDQMARVGRWLSMDAQAKDDSPAAPLLGATKFELVSWIRNESNQKLLANPSSEKEKDQAARVAENLSTFMVDIGTRGYSALVEDLIQAVRGVGGGNNNLFLRAVLHQIKGTKLEKKIIELFENYKTNKAAQMKTDAEAAEEPVAASA